MIALFTRTRRYVSPHRIVEAALPLLRELAELLDGVSVITDDDRWLDGSERFARARAAMLALSEAEQRLRARAHEVAHVDQVLANLQRLPDVVAKLRERSRKPMARVFAAKLVRRVRSAR